MENRTTVHVPKDSKLYEFLKKCDRSKSKWEHIEDVLNKEPETREDWAEKIFQEFVARMTVFYPEKKEKLKELWALVIYKIIYDEPLNEEYYEKLKKL